MRLHLLLGAGTLLGLAACQAQAKHQREHWTAYYMGPSMSRHFLTYNAETDGKYPDFLWRQTNNIGLTLRRHFFNNNPDNPFEADGRSVHAQDSRLDLTPAPTQSSENEGEAWER